MTTRYGLIGSGMMGQEHIRNIRLLDEAEVSAIADPDPDMLALSLKNAGGRARGFTDHRALLGADICDALVVVAPNDTHHRLMLDILPAGKPILCEKPLCTTLAHCREVEAAALASGTPVWVAMEYRYMPPVQRLLHEIGQGTVGTPRMMAIREHRFPFLRKVGDWNRFSRRTGGTLVEKCCHFWDLMRLALRSDPVRVYASGAMDVNHRDEIYDGARPDIIDNAFVIVDFANGARGMLDLCMFAEGSYWQETIAVTGEKARVEAFVPGPARFSADGRERDAEIAIADRATRTERREVVEVDEEILGAGDHHGSSYYQHRKFLELVRGERKAPEVTLADGSWAVLVGEAAELSAKQGRAVDLQEIDR